MMRTETHRESGALPGITVAASDYDRLVDLVFAARKDMPPHVAGYLTRELDRADVVADEAFDRSAARVGSRVVYSDNQSGRQRAVTLVWPREADVGHERISVLTSIGAALLGLRAQQSIDWPAPVGGPRSLTVVAVHNGDAPEPAPPDRAA